jgi:uncharacterized membrane protein YoaK (UPF0700 family)
VKDFKRKIAPILLLALLAASGGCMDAYSYLYCDGVFAYAQTGNILLFCINLVRGEFLQSLSYLWPILAFMGGTATAFLLERLHKGWKPYLHKWRTLLLEIVVLVGVCFVADYNHLIATAMISFVCGMQLESFPSFLSIRVATTMCIGNLRSVVHHGMECATGNARGNGLQAMLFGVALVSFALGAALGNFLVAVMGAFAVLASCILLGIAIVFAFLVYERD